MRALYDANRNSGNSNINKDIVTRVCNNNKNNSENNYSKGFQN